MAKKQIQYSRKWLLAQWLEIKWWKNYLRRQNVATYLRNKKAYWQRILRQLQLEIPSNASILDAGCGPAGIFTVLNQQSVYAIDPLLDKYTVELQHFDPSWYPQVRFYQERLEDLNLHEVFDFVFCLNAINHVDDIELALKKLVAASRRGAKIIISTDAHKSKRLMKLFQLIPGDVLHPHQFDLEKYQELFKKQGITIHTSIRLKQGRIFDYWIFIGEKV